MVENDSTVQIQKFFLWSLTRIVIFILLSSLFWLFLSNSGSEKEAEIVVEQFLYALAEKNEVVISNISCPKWEEEALLELDALQLVKSTLKDLDCFTSKKTENGTEISCNGNFTNSYNNENSEWDLSSYSFVVSNSNGTYLLCGFYQK